MTFYEFWRYFFRWWVVNVKCSQCGASFRTQAALDAHILAVHTPKAWLRTTTKDKVSGALVPYVQLSVDGVNTALTNNRGYDNTTHATPGVRQLGWTKEGYVPGVIQITVESGKIYDYTLELMKKAT